MSYAANVMAHIGSTPLLDDNGGISRIEIAQRTLYTGITLLAVSGKRKENRMHTALIRRPLVIIVGLALLLGLSGVVAPSTAQAAMSVTVVCESGLNHFSCDAYPSGGIAPYTYSWQGITNAGITNGATNQTASGTCLSWITPPTYTVQVTVRDSVGATVIKQGGGSCRSGQWQ